MSKALKGALFSALVFPGAGELMLKSYARGSAFLAVALVCLGALVGLATGDNVIEAVGKTAASAKFHQPVVEDHLVLEIAGREATKTFSGYTSCPLITRVGRAMLIEFDYNNNLVPSFPGIIAPLEELWISWLMKEIALKPTYNAMLRGLA